MKGECYGCYFCIDRKNGCGWCTKHNKEVQEDDSCIEYEGIDEHYDKTTNA